MKNKIIEAYVVLDKKVEKRNYHEEVKRIWDNFDKYWGYQNLADFEARMNPIIKRCSKQTDEWYIECYNFRKIIKRFDEVILDKASKYSINKLYEDIKVFVENEPYEKFVEQYKKKWEEINERFREMDQGLSTVRLFNNMHQFRLNWTLAKNLQIQWNKIEQQIKASVLATIGGKPLEK